MSARPAPPAEMRAALGCYEAIRRTGIRADDIYLVVSGAAQQPTDGVHLFVQVRRPGHTYNVDCGRTELDEKSLHRWVQEWNTGALDHARIYEEWLARGHALRLAQALHARGFRMPRIYPDLN